VNLQELAAEFEKLNALVIAANADPFPQVGSCEKFHAVDRLRNQLHGHLYQRMQDSPNVLLTVKMACPNQEKCAEDLGRMLRCAKDKGIVTN